MILDHHKTYSIFNQGRLVKTLGELKEMTTLCLGSNLSLNIPHNVDTVEKKELPDIILVMQEIKALEAKRSELILKLRAIFKN